MLKVLTSTTKKRYTYHFLCTLLLVPILHASFCAASSSSSLSSLPSSSFRIKKVSRAGNCLDSHYKVLGVGKNSFQKSAACSATIKNASTGKVINCSRCYRRLTEIRGGSSTHSNDPGGENSNEEIVMEKSKKTSNLGDNSNNNLGSVQKSDENTKASPGTESTKTGDPIESSKQQQHKQQTAKSDKKMTFVSTPTTSNSNLPTIRKLKNKKNHFTKQIVKPMVSNISKDLNGKIDHATNSFKHGYKGTTTKLYQARTTALQSFQDYMDAIKSSTKDFKVINNGSWKNNIEYKNIPVHAYAIQRWKQVSNIAAHAFFGMSKRQLNQDIFIWCTSLFITLIGTSVGFHSYLYFVSLGFSASIGFVALFALAIFNFLSTTPIPILSNLHTTLALLWSIRLTLFLLHREFFNWKEWHVKLQEINDRSKIPANHIKSKINVWFISSTFYSCMMIPCIYRLKAGVTLKSQVSEGVAAAVNASTQSLNRRGIHWGAVGKTGLTLQCFGLLLETIADVQKAKFKRIEGNRHLWCNVGLWSFFTHPNYLGDGLFWIGTWMGGLSCYTSIMQWTVSTMGLVFILMVMKSAIDSLSRKHMKKWGHDHHWLEFKRTHSILGPIRVSNTNGGQTLPIYR